MKPPTGGLFFFIMRTLAHFLRNILFLPIALLVTALVAGTVILLARVPHSSGMLQRLEKFWARAIVWASRLDLKADLSQLDQEATYLFIANHQSLLDIPILLCLLHTWYPRFVAK